MDKGTDDSGEGEVILIFEDPALIQQRDAASLAAFQARHPEADPILLKKILAYVKELEAEKEEPDEWCRVVRNWILKILRRDE